MRIFLDANILFSAARSDGAIRRMLALLRSAGHECWADRFVEEEARRNLAAKAGPEGHALDNILRGVRIAERPPTVDLPEAARRILPEKDRPVLAAAIALRCQALVTGDKTHFGPLYGKTIDGVTVYSPSSLALTLLTGPSSG